MQKLANFLVQRRIILLTVILIVTVACAFMALTVDTNTDMTKYLSDDSNMKQGLDIINADFPENANQSSIRVMFDRLDSAQISEIKKELEAIPYVSGVDYQADSSAYNKDGHTLFVVNSKYGYDSEEESSIERTIDEKFSSYQMIFQNNDVQSSEASPILLISALLMALLILVIMSQSWLEPVLFMVTIGIAVVINLGTNIFFPYVSDLTASVAPIIQLALSMDYSIILMNRYRQEKKLNANKTDAMKAALAKSFSSIASSALTTAVGLLALVFLSFKIGPELGIVLAKGVFISMLCVFTVLPVLILWCDGGIEKSHKKSPHIPMGIFAKLSHKARYIMPILFAVMFVAFGIIQNNTGITFTEKITDPMADIFPKDNTVLLVYNNADESNIDGVISEIQNDGHVKEIVGYTNTLGKQYASTDMAKIVTEMGGTQIESGLLDTVYYLYHNGELPLITVGDFIKFIKTDVLTNQTLSVNINQSMVESIAYIERFADGEKLTKKMTAEEIADFFGMTPDSVTQLFMYYFTVNGGVDSTAMTASAFTEGKLSPQEFIGFTVDMVLPDEAFAGYFDSGTAERLKVGRIIIDAAVSEKKYAVSEMYALLAAFAGDISSNEVELLYLYYAAFNYSDAEWTMSLTQLFEYLNDNLIGDERFAGILGEQAAVSIAEGKAVIDDSIAQMKGEKYSRLILTTDYPEESSETSAYMEKLDGLRRTYLKNDSYLAGTSAMVYEMENSFNREFLIITLITAGAIFLVVLIAFRNLIVPALLTLLVQCGVYITVSVIGVNGGTMYYLALLIVQSILMGATIDYGIVFSNYYREFRQTMDRAEAVKAAYENSIHTIMTSGSILILVTGILGIFSKAQVVSQVTLTISIGSLVAVLLILLVLPGTLDFFDRFAVRLAAKKSNG